MLPNPLIPGFNPDPSVVLADGAYYLVTSTFEYLPGIPVYRSTDLITWTHRRRRPAAGLRHLMDGIGFGAAYYAEHQPPARGRGIRGARRAGQPGRT